MEGENAEIALRVEDVDSDAISAMECVMLNFIFLVSQLLAHRGFRVGIGVN